MIMVKFEVEIPIHKSPISIIMIMAWFGLVKIPIPPIHQPPCHVFQPQAGVQNPGGFPTPSSRLLFAIASVAKALGAPRSSRFERLEEVGKMAPFLFSGLSIFVH